MRPAKGEKLTPKQRLFVKHYLLSLNSHKAALAAGYSKKTARQIGVENLSKPLIMVAIDAEMEQRAKRVDVSADDVLKRLWERVNADPRELTELRHTCCRHCHGIGFGFQLTPAEKLRVELGSAKPAVFASDDEEELWKQKRDRRVKKAPKIEVGDVIDPDVADGPVVFGGTGWDPRKDPKAGCPECLGVGVARVVINDTRRYSDSAQRLFAGVSRGKDGIKVEMHNQQADLIKIGEHLGMFKGGPNIVLNIDWENLTDAQMQHLAEGGSIETLPR